MGEIRQSNDRKKTACAVLVNPFAQGGRVSRSLAEIELIVRACAPSVQVYVSQSINDANRWLCELPRTSKVIVAGGDGTVQSALATLIDNDHALGILPLGSGNDGARALGTYGGDWRDTLKRLLRSTTTRVVDIGCVEIDQRRVLFLVALNAGFDAAIAARALNGPKWLRGLPRYVFATLRELAAIQHWNIELLLDGKLHFSGDALFASALNAATFGSGMPAVPHARIDDGALDILVARRFTRSGALVMLPRLLRGTHLSDPRISTRNFSTMQLTSKSPIPLAADGEFLGETRHLAINVNAQSMRAIS